jgi:FixJ family two-component response regulator
MRAAHVEPSDSAISDHNQIIHRSTTVALTHQNLAQDTVYLVSGDQQVHCEVAESIEKLGIGVVSFFSEKEYLSSPPNDSAGCLILDMELGSTSGLEVQRRLLPDVHPPVIFIGNPCNIRSTVSAMKSGAIDLLTRPIDPLALLASIRMAFEQDYRKRQKKMERESLHQRLSLLTPREREVLPLVVGGLLNKQAASLLDISEVTLQIHRSKIMRKMAAESLADLVRMALKLRIAHWREVKTT